MSVRRTVLVCGDAARGDDGAAIATVARLDRREHPDLRVRRVGQLEPDDLVEALSGGGRCVVVDAVRGIEPGRILAIPLRRLGVPGGPQPASSHALPLEVVIGLAEALGADLDRSTFVGIGGSAFDLGAGLSPAVEDALEGAGDLIERVIADPDMAGAR